MKQIINLISLALASACILYIGYYVDARDICRTIFGCTALITWVLTFNMEK